MAGTPKRSTAEPEHAPAPAGAAVYERADWLNSIPPGLDWLDPLRGRHLAAAHGFADAVQRLADVRAERHDLERHYREQVRDALAASETAPERPAELDPARRDALVSLAAEDVATARETLSGIVVEVLAALRGNRLDLDFATLSPALVGALTVGGANQAQALLAQATARMGDISNGIAVIQEVAA